MIRSPGRFPRGVLGVSLACIIAASVGLKADDDARGPDGWTARSPRDEVRPEFAYRPDGGPDGRGSLVIKADGREGLIGWWEKTFSVEGGRTYRFAARRKVEQVETPRRTAVA